MACIDCIYGRCIGIRNKDGVKLYKCHRDKPIWLGEYIIRECEFWEKKDNVIRIFNSKR